MFCECSRKISHLISVTLRRMGRNAAAGDGVL
jgi:hypothetical protein